MAESPCGEPAGAVTPPLRLTGVSCSECRGENDAEVEPRLISAFVKGSPLMGGTGEGGREVRPKGEGGERC